MGQGENACWQLTARRGRLRRAERFLLRVHNPVYQDARTVPGELHWLAALRRDTALAIPEPIRTHAGKWAVAATGAGVPEPRAVSVLGWSEGRHGFRDKTPRRCEAVGRLQAALHLHAERYRSPKRMARRDWGFAGLTADVLTRIPRRGPGRLELAALDREQRAVVRRAAARVRRTLQRLGRGRREWGMIHADLHFANVVFTRDGAAAFDFDDCGPGHFATDAAITLWGPWTERGYRARFLGWRRGYESVRPISPAMAAAIPEMLYARVLRHTLRSCAHLQHRTAKACHAPGVLRWALPRLRRWVEAPAAASAPGRWRDVPGF